MTPRQVADRWICSTGHVRRLCRRGDLSAMRLGSDWRISETAVEAYEDRNTTVQSQPTAAPKEVPIVNAVAGVALPADYEPVFRHLWGLNEKSASARN